MSNDNKRPIIVQEGAPEWVLTYGDMMSLLLTFFIMLYSISTLEVVKFQAASESLQNQFGAPPGGGTKGQSGKTSVRSQGRAKKWDMLQGGQPVAAPVGDEMTVRSVRTSADPVNGGVIMFDVGSDRLSQSAMNGLKIIAEKVSGSPFKIEIRGHTAPVEKGIYSRNNWDLGYARSFNVMEYLVKECGLSPKNVRISVVAQHEPPSESLQIKEGADRAAGLAFVEVLQTVESLTELQADQADTKRKFQE